MPHKNRAGFLGRNRESADLSLLPVLLQWGLFKPRGVSVPHLKEKQGHKGRIKIKIKPDLQRASGGTQLFWECPHSKRGKLNVWNPQNWSDQHLLTLGEQLVVVPGYKKEEQLCKLSFQGGIFVCVLKAQTKKDLKSFGRRLLRHGKSVMFLKPGGE